MQHFSFCFGFYSVVFWVERKRSANLVTIFEKVTSGATTGLLHLKRPSCQRGILSVGTWYHRHQATKYDKKYSLRTATDWFLWILKLYIHCLSFLFCSSQTMPTCLLNLVYVFLNKILFSKKILLHILCQLKPSHLNWLIQSCFLTLVMGDS